MASKNIYYSTYRSEFKDGDILMFKGRGIVSSIIKWKTKSPYSHAGIVAWWNERLMVLEAVGKGVEARPISFLLKHYEGSFDYYRPKKESGINNDQRNKMTRFAKEQLGKEYATIHIIKFFFRLLLGLKMARRDKAQPPGKFFCSQFVSAVYNAAGTDLEIQFSDKFTTPSQISESELLEYVATIKKDIE